MFALFAQAGVNANNDEFTPEELAIISIVCGAIFFVWLIVSGFFLNSVSRTLHLCRPRNRTMEPGQVWLNLIPGFNTIWFFITVSRIAESLKLEYASRGWSTRQNFSHTLGIVLAVFSLLNCGCYVGGLIPLVLFIMYWQRIAEYNRELTTRYSDYDEDEEDELDGGDRYDDEYDDRDDRPRNRR
jgi:hypothetical protein